MRHSFLLLAAVTAGLCFAPRTADAKPKLSVDVDVAVPVDAPALQVGVGAAGRFGYELHVPLVSFTPEIGGGYQSFGGNFGIARGIAGARLGFFEAVRPGIYAHAGVGASTGVPSMTGFTWDAGAFLDFTLLPILDLGVHAGYAQLDTAKWVNAGAHAAIVF